MAHSGGLAANGCYNDRKNGGRHCHLGQSSAQPASPQRAGGEVYYPNCTAARKADAARSGGGSPATGATSIATMMAQTASSRA